MNKSKNITQTIDTSTPSGSMDSIVYADTPVPKTLSNEELRRQRMKMVKGDLRAVYIKNKKHGVSEQDFIIALQELVREIGDK